MLTGVRFGAVITYQTTSEEKAKLKVNEIDRRNRLALISVRNDFLQVRDDFKEGFTVVGLTGPDARAVFRKLGVTVGKNEDKEQIDEKLLASLKECFGEDKELGEGIARLVDTYVDLHKLTGGKIRHDGIDFSA
jgi:hypothetical protein